MSACPLCTSAAANWTKLGPFTIDQCSRCLHRFVAEVPVRSHIADVYDDAYFNGGGAGYTNYLAQRELLCSRGKWYGELVKRLTGGSVGRVLDVGAAAGFLLSGWKQAGWQSVGIEPNRSMTLEAAKLGLDVRCGAFESETFFEEASFDCVAMIQVISHLVDPRLAIAKAYHLLRPGGVLLVETWDRGSVIARLLGKGWHEYSPPSVLHWFTRAGLQQVMVQRGFEPIGSRRALRWIHVGHAKSILQHSAKKSLVYTGVSSIMKILPSGWSLPYPGDDLFWALYRKPVRP